MRTAEVISLDGGAKTGKSTIGLAVALALGNYMRVKTADAGAFYRRTTVSAFDVLGIDGSQTTIPDLDLDYAVAQAIKAGTPFEDGYDFGDLERPEVQRWVSVVGRRSSVQEAAMGWFGVTVGQTLKTADVLVINARNPRRHMAQWLANGPLHVSMELFVDCDPEVAARRKLAKEDVLEPADLLLAAETAAIIGRRDSDLTRPTDKFILPSQVVGYELTNDISSTIALSRQASAEFAPLPIGFDTSFMPKDEMLVAAQGLALVSLGLPV